jgi:hypothetical protein
MVQSSRTTGLKIAVTVALLAGAGIALWQFNRHPSATDEENGNASAAQGEGMSPTTTGHTMSPADSNTGTTTGENAAGQNANGTPSSDGSARDAISRVENGEAAGSGEFTRASFFKPVDWGADQNALGGKEAQTLTFAPSCKNHPRNTTTTATHPAQWAEAFTGTDSQQRWPAANTHVVDWNQFWTLADAGYQISIRWNFENPPRYSVVGYSFQINKPDGYGAAVFPEKMNLSWDEAKTFVQEWEKAMLEKGGRLGTRTMTLAEKVFNPADVSPEDIERAEYSNSQIRGAQTGKMSCNTSHTDLSQLKCSCWF